MQGVPEKNGTKFTAPQFSNHTSHDSVTSGCKIMVPKTCTRTVPQKRSLTLLTAT